MSFAPLAIWSVTVCSWVGGGTSSLVIVPVATPSARVAATGDDSVTVKVSAGSTVVSPRTVTGMVCAVVVPEKVSDPLVMPV